MAMGALSSLGLGSQGALSYDIIDKLKEADKSAIISPIDKKLEKIETEKKDLAVITTLVAKLKSSASSLSDETLYEYRETSVSGDSVTAKAEAGVALQDFTIDVKSLASRDIYESKGFSSKNSSFTDKEDTLTLTIDSTTYEIDVDPSMTISDLVDKINEETDGKIKASILDTGGDDPYKIILKSAETGAKNKIEIASSDTADALGFTQIGDGAKDAVFTYNGIEITRSSNEVTDLISGLTLNLEKTGESKIKIEQNTEKVEELIKEFAKNYNELINNLKEATKYDDETRQAGTFQGNSNIINIKTQINRDLLFIKDGISIADFGIKLNESGMMEFDQAKFDEQITKDPSKVKEFFVGKTTYYPTEYTTVEKKENTSDIELSGEDLVINGVPVTLQKGEVNLKNLADAINEADIPGVKAVYDDESKKFSIVKKSGGDIIISGDSEKLSKLGINTGVISGKTEQTEGLFAKLNNDLKSMISGPKASLSMFETSLNDQKKKLEEEKKENLKRLDQRYEMMANKFAAYDSMINTMTQQFQALQMQIDAQINGKQ